MALNILFETISPSLALALNNKYAQPELVGFEQANTSEMVDLFTGDFKYNIPLMDVDGSPLKSSGKPFTALFNTPGLKLQPSPTQLASLSMLLPAWYEIFKG